MRIVFLVPSLCFIMLSLTGCVPTMMFGAATSATTTVAEERGVGGSFADTSIRARINMKWASNKSELLSLVEVTVREGRVLLSGTVDKHEQQIEAIRLVWEVSGVKEVIDKMEVGEGNGFFGYMGDSWITTKLKGAMLTDKEIHSINYTLKTINGTVYIMGIALSTKELERVITRARNMSGVEKVISYVRVKEQTTTGNTAYGQSDPGLPGGPPPESLEAVSVESIESPNTGSSFD